MNETRRTPGKLKPISTGRRGRGQMGELFDLINDAKAENVEVVALKLSKADAEHACRAWNNHEALLQICKRILNRLPIGGSYRDLRLEQIDLEDLRQAIADAETEAQ